VNDYNYAAVNPGNTCPNCGQRIPAGALAGLCPACLLAQAGATELGDSPPAPRFEAPPIEELAKLFPQLQILSLLGAGGMGAVYKARQPALDRFVALKILPSQNASGANFQERFNREARALARLSHPNIVAVFEFGETGGLRFFVMEFVDGTNLRQLERAGRLSSREALQIIPQICDALQYAHDEGVVHRDIKPENVLVDRRGRVKIADFGLAKILGRDAEALRLTVEGQVMGTPHYMAPEQVEKPMAVDHRADIYSLGVVFYEMLTGDLPLGKFSPPSKKVQVDVRLDEVVLRALENDPARRYQHASEVKSRVETIAGTPMQTVPQPPPSSKAPWNGFPVVIERNGVRKINWGGVTPVFAITFGLLSVAFGLVTVFTGRSLLGWIGVVGWQSVVARLFITTLIAGWEVLSAFKQPSREGRVWANLARNIQAFHSSRSFRWVRVSTFILVCIGAWIWFQLGWLTPFLRARSDVPPTAHVILPDPASRALVAKLPAGGSVELLGLSDQSTSNHWWQADGMLLTNADFELRGPRENPRDGYVIKDILIRLLDLPKDASAPMIIFKPSVSSMRSDLTLLDHDQSFAGAWPWRVAFPITATEATIQVGVGFDPWRTILTHSAADHSSQEHRHPRDPHWHAALHQIVDNGSGTQVTLMLENAGSRWYTRTVAVDLDEVEHLESPGTGNGKGIWVTPKENTFTWTYNFRDLPLSAVKGFRVQVRPVYWVEFPNVALQPREQRAL
jgi:predicted Ser/Thr protein kinase